MILRALVALLVLSLSIASAMSGEIRELTYSRNTSDSRCIGNPVTPLCAVETMEACLIWSEAPLCLSVGIDPERFSRGIASDYLRLQIHKYEIKAQRVLMADDVPAGKRNLGSRSWRAGDVAVQLWWIACRPTDRCVDESRNDPNRRYGEGYAPVRCIAREGSPDTYIVRRQRDGNWPLIDDFYGPVLPDEFWKRK